MKATWLIMPGYEAPDSKMKCCLCGAPSEGRKATDIFGNTFRDYREMAYRLSPYICEPCALSMKDVPSGVVNYIDGTQKFPRSALRGLGWRFFSWVLVEGREPIGATKAHCKELREFMRNPPVGKKFAVVIADSGQKQLLYRLDVQTISADGDPYVAQFETEQVPIDTRFWELLRIADKIASVLGKTRVGDPENYLAMGKYIEAYGRESAGEYLHFTKLVDTPQGRLCGFLALNSGRSDNE